MAVVTPDLPELFEEAFERAGLEMRSGYDLKTARRSFQILTLEWQNRGINLFTIESGTLSLSAGTATYTLPTDTIDLIEHTIRTGSGTSQLDTNVTRISVSTFAQKSNKNTQGKPNQIFVQRLAGSTTVTLHPVPDTTYKFRVHFNAAPALLEGDGTNYISLNFPNGLLYCCLSEAYGFLKGPIDMLTLYENKYKQEVQKFANEQVGRRRRDDYTDGAVRIPVTSANP